MATYETLVTTGYTVPGAYIGELITPRPRVAPSRRYPAFVGKGSRFAIASNSRLRRSFVFDEALTFSGSAPFRANLDFPAVDDKIISRLIDVNTNVVVKANQWRFVEDTNGELTIVEVSTEVYDPTTTYQISYQSSSRDVKDPFPVQDIREFQFVGDGPDNSQYNEYESFFADFSVAGSSVSDPLAVTASLDNDAGSMQTAISAVTASLVGGSTGTVVVATSADYEHNYNRYYKVRCIATTGSAGTATATFEWSSDPVSSGNNSLPPVPLEPSMPKPTFTVNAASAPTLTQELELGVILTFAPGGTNFVPGDTFTLNAFGPARIEIDERLANTNQFHQASAVTRTAGAGFATIGYATSSDPTNVYNAKFKVECYDATDSAVKATLTHSRDGNGLTLTAKVGGLAGNSITFGLVDPATPLSPLVVNVTGNDVRVTLATDGSGNIISTYTQVSAAINALESCPVSSTVLGVGATVASPYLAATADVATSASQVLNRRGIAFTSEIAQGASIKLRVNNVVSSDSYVIATGGVAASTLTFAIGSPVPSATAETALTGTVDVTASSAVVDGQVGVSQFLSELTVGQPVKFSAQPNVVYKVANIIDDEQFILDRVYSGVTTAGGDAYVDFAEILVVSQPLVSGDDGVFTAEVGWAEHGERIGISGLASLSYNQATPATAVNTISLGNGIVLEVDFSSGPLAVGDVFSLEVKAPREYYRAKDNRIVVITTENTANSAGVGTVEATYVTDTLEGSFGSFEAQSNLVAANNPDSTDAVGAWHHGAFQLPGNLLLYVRNMQQGPSTANGGNRHVAGNKFTFSATISGTINWSLKAKTSETFEVSDVLTDVRGARTAIDGVAQPGTPYIILQNVPDTVLSVVDTETDLPVAYEVIEDANGDATQYVKFTAGKPTNPVVVSYIYRGQEPAPGQIYFVTSKHVRPAELYNTPIRVLSLDEGRRLLAPSEIDNHLFIMNEIAMGDAAAPGIYVVQVEDSDSDGFLTDLDYKDAISASEGQKEITDLIVLSHFSSLNDQLSSVTRMSDPFRRRFRLGWFGAPIGTEIGAKGQPGTLVDLASRTLQVFGKSTAHGTRIMVASTEATRDIRLQDGSVVEVELDGSFVAGALAAMTAAFTDPASTLLRQNLVGFKTVQTYGSLESAENNLLMSNQIITFTDVGGGVYRIEESTTVDPMPTFSAINAMTQRMYVSKLVRDELDAKVIGAVPSSVTSGKSLIMSFLTEILLSLQGRGLIASYQNDDGSERNIDPAKDIVVFPDSTDPTLYHILFSFFIRSEVKRIFGLYAVNESDIAAGS